MVFNKLNDAYQTVKNALDVEVALATADQKELLVNAKLALAELKDLTADLKNENRDLKDKVQTQAAMVPDEGHEWLKIEKDKISTRRYCQICYYDRDKTIPLNNPVESHAKFHAGQRWCPICKDYRK